MGGYVKNVNRTNNADISLFSFFFFPSFFFFFFFFFEIEKHSADDKIYVFVGGNV